MLWHTKNRFCRFCSGFATYLFVILLVCNNLTEERKAGCSAYCIHMYVNCQHIGQGKLLLYQQGTLIHYELFYHGGYFTTLL